MHTTYAVQMLTTVSVSRSSSLEKGLMPRSKHYRWFWRRSS